MSNPKGPFEAVVHKNREDFGIVLTNMQAASNAELMKSLNVTNLGYESLLQTLAGTVQGHINVSYATYTSAEHNFRLGTEVWLKTKLTNPYQLPGQGFSAANVTALRDYYVRYYLPWQVMPDGRVRSKMATDNAEIHVIASMKDTMFSSSILVTRGNMEALYMKNRFKIDFDCDIQAKVYGIEKPLKFNMQGSGYNVIKANLTAEQLATVRTKILAEVKGSLMEQAPLTSWLTITDARLFMSAEITTRYKSLLFQVNGTAQLGAPGKTVVSSLFLETRSGRNKRLVSVWFECVSKHRDFSNHTQQ